MSYVAIIVAVERNVALILRVMLCVSHPTSKTCFYNLQKYWNIVDSGN